MDNEYILRQFEEIEKKVEKLVDAYKSLEVSNLKLSNKIKRLKEELQSKVEAENNYAKGKALIGSKIDSLLIRLEDITGTE